LRRHRRRVGRELGGGLGELQAAFVEALVEGRVRGLAQPFQRLGAVAAAPLGAGDFEGVGDIIGVVDPAVGKL
jgi:hypothetical protein